MSPRDAFPGYDDPVNIEGDPEEILRALLAKDCEDQSTDDEPEPGSDSEG